MPLIKNSFKSVRTFPYSFMYAGFATLFSLVIFFLLSNLTQVAQIFALHIDLYNKISITVDLFLEIISTISATMTLLMVVYFSLLYLVFVTMFAIFFHKRKQFKNSKEIFNNQIFLKEKTIQQKIFISFSFILSFLGFGCVACGQALVLSLLSIFVTNLTLSIAYTFSYIILIVGNLFLIYALYKNMKVLNNPNVCPI